MSVISKCDLIVLCKHIPKFILCMFYFREEDLNSVISSLSEETKTQIYNNIIQTLRGKESTDTWLWYYKRMLHCNQITYSVHVWFCCPSTGSAADYCSASLWIKKSKFVQQLNAFVVHYSRTDASPLLRQQLQPEFLQFPAAFIHGIPVPQPDDIHVAHASRRNATGECVEIFRKLSVVSIWAAREEGRWLILFVMLLCSCWTPFLRLTSGRSSVVQVLSTTVGSCACFITTTFRPPSSWRPYVTHANIT